MHYHTYISLKDSFGTDDVGAKELRWGKMESQMELKLALSNLGILKGTWEKYVVGSGNVFILADKIPLTSTEYIGKKDFVAGEYWMTLLILELLRKSNCRKPTRS